MNTLTQLNTPAARAAIYAVASGILAMFGAGAVVSQDSFNAWYTVVFSVVGIVPLIMAALHVNKAPTPPPAENTIAAGIHSTLAYHDGLAVHVMPSSTPDAPVELPTYNGESVGDVVDDHEEPVRGRHAR